MARNLVVLNAPWRRMFAKRTVRRHILGTDLYMPWSHALPEWSRPGSRYGLNLLELATALAGRMAPGELPMTVLDIGANIGDSAALIMARADARVLCVEGDPYWARYLHLNLDGDDRAVLEEALLVPDEEGSVAAGPQRSRNSTAFVDSSADVPAVANVSVRALRDKHPAFSSLRLVKSDTDGFDAALVPAVAEVWADARPVLFFEFDPAQTRAVGNDEPQALWPALAALGYSAMAVWDNAGDPLGRLDIADAPVAAATLEPRPTSLGYRFWDVAACHADDAAGAQVLSELVPEPFSATPRR